MAPRRLSTFGLVLRGTLEFALSIARTTFVTVLFGPSVGRHLRGTRCGLLFSGLLFRSGLAGGLIFPLSFFDRLIDVDVRTIGFRHFGRSYITHSFLHARHVDIIRGSAVFGDNTGRKTAFTRMVENGLVEFESRHVSCFLFIKQHFVEI